MENTWDLVFLTDMTTPLAVAVVVGTVLAYAAFALAFFRAAGLWRGLALALLRGGVVGMLGLICLRPAVVTYSDEEFPLPESYVRKEIQPLPPGFTERLLPPWFEHHDPPSIPGEDVEIQSVSVPPLAFYKGRCPISVIVANHGTAQTGDVVLFRLDDGKSVEFFRDKVTLQQGRQELRLSLVPDRLGRQAWGVALEGFPQNSEAGNDRHVFGVTAVRDSLRLLHIAGHPSWDVRFMREFLGGIPGVELISFYLLMDAEDFAPHSPEELALIPFPTDELFLEEIGNFDVIVVQNFPLGSYVFLKEQHRQMMVRYVKEGGALFFIGGDLAYQLGKVDAVEVAEILPVKLSEAASGDLMQEPFVVETLTEALLHPIVAIPGPDGNHPLEEGGLPALTGLNDVGPLREDSTGLLYARMGTQQRVLLAAREEGLGRVLLLATDHLWRWAFPSPDAVSARQVYRELLWNSLAWLSGDPRMDEVRISPRRTDNLAQQETDLIATVLSDSADPAKLELEARWTDAAGKQGGMTVRLKPVSREGNTLQFRLPPARVGAWFVDAVGGEGARSRGSVVVALNPPAVTGPDWVAKAIDPVLRTPPQPLSLAPSYPVHLQPDSLTIRRPHLHHIGFHPLMFVALLVFLLGEWVLRRFWGHL